MVDVTIPRAHVVAFVIHHSHPILALDIEATDQNHARLPGLGPQGPWWKATECVAVVRLARRVVATATLSPAALPGASWHSFKVLRISGCSRTEWGRGKGEVREDIALDRLVSLLGSKNF